MSSYEALQKEFNEKVEHLQQTCTHPKISEWIEEHWAIGHPTGYEVQYCEICNLRLHERTICHICNKIIQDDEICRGDGKLTLLGVSYCKNCYLKGDPWCLENPPDTSKIKGVTIIDPRKRD